jgi:NAD(P)-dependent dehydrogenase (short-subunit alcohol dehydrogenase family)
MAKEQKTEPAQEQHHRPGIESEMRPTPEAEDHAYRASGKLDGRVALITGGDLGIGRAVAILFAKEGADVAISYLNEHDDARETRRQVEQEGGRCILIPGDVGDESYCRRAVRETMDQLGQLHILVNNAAEQHPQESIEAISAEQLERTFRVNILPSA